MAANRQLLPLLLLASAAAAVAAAAGCATTGAKPVPVAPAQADVWRGDGTPATWSEMIQDLAAADAVFLGEEHDDGAGHALQRHVVAELLTRWGGGVVSLEMLERDEQASVDGWLAGDLSDAEMIAATGSASWAGAGSWEAWYQPILAAAKANGGTVIAANCPREYVRTALRDGYGALPGWDAPERAQFDLPGWEHEEYREALLKLMVEARTERAGEAAAQEGETAATEEVVVGEEELDRALRAQLVWDATMSRSASAARVRGRVIHIAGHFHIDWAGATVGEYRKLRPDDEVRTVTVRQVDGYSPADSELGMADWIIGSASAVVGR